MSKKDMFNSREDVDPPKNPKPPKQKFSLGDLLDKLTDSLFKGDLKAVLKRLTTLAVLLYVVYVFASLSGSFYIKSRWNGALPKTLVGDTSTSHAPVILGR